MIVIQEMQRDVWPAPAQRATIAASTASSRVP